MRLMDDPETEVETKFIWYYERNDNSVLMGFEQWQPILINTL